MAPLVFLNNLSGHRAAAVLHDVEFRRVPLKVRGPLRDDRGGDDDERRGVTRAKVGVLRRQHTDGRRASSGQHSRPVHIRLGGSDEVREQRRRVELRLRGDDHDHAFAVHPRGDEPADRRVVGR